MNRSQGRSLKITMRHKPTIRGIAIFATVLLGGALGFVCGGELCVGILHLQGRGNSHNDMYPVVASAMAGLIVGVLLTRLGVWFFFAKDAPPTVLSSIC